ncbi:type IV secretory system conjugative DNA transfer family protein [Solihabitans fulvus]|nr:type IV secretory system conjugative DNA transfer family protein [Solihabitans fulvus]
MNARSATLTPIAPLVVAGLVAAVYVGIAVPWTVAHLVAPSDWVVPRFSAVPRALFRNGVAGLIGPHGSTTWFAVATTVELTVLVGIATSVVVFIRRHVSTPDGRAAMSKAASWSDMRGSPLATRTKELRPSLGLRSRRQLGGDDLGVKLGTIGGREVRKSFEDAELVVMGPRSNKTSACVVPEVLSACGVVVATSNKPDVWQLTRSLREEVGETFTFDPQRVVHAEQTFWVNLLRYVRDVDSAARLAKPFMQEVGGGSGQATLRSDPFFTTAAEDTLTLLLLAAGVGLKNLRDVLIWVANRSHAPAGILDQQGFPALGAMLRGTLDLPPETRGGVFANVLAALGSLRSESNLRWVTPPNTWQLPPRSGQVVELDMWELIASGHSRPATLYLLSREGEGTARPIITAFVKELLTLMTEAARARGGRLDPPATVVLDEAANICKLDSLPSLYSFCGSMGIMLTTIVQSRNQGREVWGRDGFDALWSAATIKLVGAGVSDADLAEDLSRLVGEHEVTKLSTSTGAGGRSTSASLHRERIMEAADIAALPKTHALLLTSGRRPGMLRLAPWYSERDAADITARYQQATSEIQQAAVAYLGADNPVARALLQQHGSGQP